MGIEAANILSVLDQCCDRYTFPMLDNGYFYLAATRLSLHRTSTDWAMVFEVFGYSPRAGQPNLFIETFASTLCERDIPEVYVNVDAYEKYLANNPNNEFRAVYPIDGDDWIDDQEGVVKDAKELVLRCQKFAIPSQDEYAERGITLEEPPHIKVYELCRFVADVAHDSVLATTHERRQCILPEMVQILQLEDWHHPNVKDSNDRPSGSETFQQLAKVLATGNVALYKPSQLPNTHWRNWPEGGSL
ncbi:MAG: hypothetical protein ABSD59_00765 [Terracidiphilus sp.]|jgi:hypothetical protein